jgi:hypothetical protein
LSLENKSEKHCGGGGEIDKSFQFLGSRQSQAFGHRTHSLNDLNAVTHIRKYRRSIVLRNNKASNGGFCFAGKSRIKDSKDVIYKVI